MPAVKKAAKAATPVKKAASKAAKKTAKKTAAVLPAPPKPKKAAAAPKASKLAKPAKAEKADKAAKARKPKLVRDSFSMPKNEFAALATLKTRAAKLGRAAKKSEVLRAGIMALSAMGDAAFLAAVSGVPAVKTGRPAKGA